MQAEFDVILRFLASLDLFSDQEMTILLPLANSIVKKKFTFGQYILKEGEIPKGLYIIVKG